MSCDVVYVSPRPTADAIAAFYSAAGRYDRWTTQPGRAGMWRRRVDRISRLVPRGGRLLDVGTGQGDFCAAASRHFDVEATEISSEGVRLTRERHGAAVHHGELLDLALPSEHFDAVTLWHVLEHVVNPRDVAAECRRLLKPGGVVAIAVPNADEDWQFTRRIWSDALQFALGRPLLHLPRVPIVDHGLVPMLGRMPLRRIGISRVDLGRPHEEIHLTHFTIETLARMLESIGLTIVERGIDDQSPDSGVRARIRHWRQVATYRMTGRAAANAIFVAARKRA
jgi:SAM-dependent methyltransferase